VFLSGAAPVPWRSKPTEEAIIGTKLDDATIAKAAEATVAGAEPLEHNGYKVPLFEGVMDEPLPYDPVPDPYGVGGYAMQNL
jgi:xanthine dehydrogenase YagS FAD-binding subunit